MKERPILFSGEMVRAILDGRKTQTRRPVKPQPWVLCIIEEGIRGESPWVYSALTGYGPGYDVNEIRTPCKCPLGQPGDRLWVRETFMHEPADYIPTVSVSHPVRPEVLIYRADYPEPKNGDGWRPSIHMPRWASRITLEIVRVSVERVQDITDANAFEEGAPTTTGCLDHPCVTSFRQGFHDLWQSIYGTWDANPWVWAVEFRRVKP